MPRILLQIAAVSACVAWSCSFDESGVSVTIPDRSTDLPIDAGTDLPPDLPPEASIDAGSDAPGPACLPEQTGISCSFEQSSAGASGICVDGDFAINRFCFDDAPCSDGVCTKQAQQCTPCNSDADCDGSCTVLFIKTVGTRRCCVDKSENGDGHATTSCSASGSGCRSGLCTTAGKCFVACSSSEHCPGGQCAPLEIQLAGTTYKQTGCVGGTTPDAAVDSTVDAGVDVGIDVGVDLGLDVGVDGKVDGPDGAVDADVDADGDGSNTDALADMIADATDDSVADLLTDGADDSAGDSVLDGLSDTTGEATVDTSQE